MPRYAKLKLTAALVSSAFLMAGLSACGKNESTVTLMADAQKYQQSGNLKAALIQLKNAVEKSPENGEARMQLAQLEMEMGDFLSADKELRKAQSLGIVADRVLPLLGKGNMQMGQPKKLLEDIPAEKAANSAPLLTLRGDALLMTGKADEAKQAFEKALAINPNSGDALLGLAHHAMIRQDLPTVQRLVNDAITKDPKNPEVWAAQGTLLRTSGKPDEALAAYDKALELKPNHRTVHIEKAYIEIARGKFPAAKAEIDAAEKTSPNNLLVTYTRALYEFSQGKYAAAEDALQKILKSAPEHMPSVLLAGASELNLGSLGQAEMHLRKYLEADPTNIYARKLLAQTQLKSARPDNAVATLAPVLKDSTNDAQLLALAGESYMQVRDFSKASDYLEKAATLAPKAAAVRTSLGLSKLAQGDQARGLSELELATSLDPKSANATLVLVQTEMNLKHYDKALAAINALEKQQPDNPQVWSVKGGVYMGKGDMANARAAFEKAAALQPTFFPAIANLARLDLVDKKPDAAKQRFEKLLEKDKNNTAAMTALGELALLQKQNDQATGWFEKASNTNPDAVAPAVKLGMHYLRSNQAPKALTLARKFQTANPTNPELLELLGQAQVVNKDLPGALDTFSKLTNVLPKSAQAQLRLAGVHMAMKNETAAGNDIKRAVELEPTFVPARLAQVELAMRTGHPDEALHVAREVQKLAPQNALGYALEGDVFVAQNKAAQALPVYERALSISKSPEVFAKTMQIMGQIGKTKEVKVRGEQWLNEHPNDVRVAMMVAEVNMANKDYKSAIALLQGAQKQAPNNPILLNNLAWAYQQEKDPRALETAEQAFKLAADSPGIMDTLGWMLAEQGDTKRALPLLQKASDLAPNALEIHYHFAVALHKSGDKQGARKELDKILAQNKPFAQIDDARALIKTL